MTSHPNRSRRCGIDLLALIQQRKAEMAADHALMATRPADMPRAAWRMQAGQSKISLEVIDRSATTRPRRRLDFDLGLDLLAWKATPDGARIAERIDLQAPDAAERLAKFELV